MDAATSAAGTIGRSDPRGSARPATDADTTREQARRLEPRRRVRQLVAHQLARDTQSDDDARRRQRERPRQSGRRGLDQCPEPHGGAEAGGRAGEGRG